MEDYGGVGVKELLHERVEKRKTVDVSSDRQENNDLGSMEWTAR